MDSSTPLRTEDVGSPLMSSPPPHPTPAMAPIRIATLVEPDGMPQDTVYLVTGANRGNSAFLFFYLLFSVAAETHSRPCGVVMIRTQPCWPSAARQIEKAAFHVLGLNETHAKSTCLGIGLALVAALLTRPSTTVVATVRDPASQAAALAALPSARGSRLLVIALSFPHVPENLEPILSPHGITHIDVVISNAAVQSSFEPILSADPKDLLLDYEINAVGQLRLFQAAWPLLSKFTRKKFVLLTSSVGSITVLDYEVFPGISYGPSKAGANWIAKRIAVEFKSQGLLVGILHPG